MRPSIRAASGLLLGVCAAQACAITLTPNAIGGGNIPGKYPIVDFHTWDGDWAPTLKLPASAPAGATITIHANATWSSNVALDNTDIPLQTLTLSTGEQAKFTFDATTGRWNATLKEFVATGTVITVPNTALKLTRVRIGSKDVAQRIVLPASAPPGAIVIVQSDSKAVSRVDPANVLYASTMLLSANERYVYAFHAELKKWYLTASTSAALGPQDLDRGEMRPVTRARTELALPAGTSVLSIKLPATAGDRDRVRVRSDATAASTIRNDGIDFAGTLRVVKGNAYDFMWVAEKKRWVLMASPTVVRGASQLSGGRLPDTSTPTTRLQASDGNWTPTVVLPAKAKSGDRVIVESAATWGFNVVPGGASATFASQPVGNGDTIAFVVDSQGRWTRETRTIDMLNIYADKVVAAYGGQAARARQLESFRLTNEALENSGANFRLRMVGLMQHRDQGASLGDALERLRDDVVVQNERKRLKADALYYEGAEEGCGLAWVNSYPSAYNMIASGSIHCGTTVMRHEFGHNMGLAYGGTPGTPVYATGYSLLGTVMGGNAIPYFSTPRRYDAQLGVPMGVVNVIDATRAMDEHSEEVSNFYR
jgi:hypothetical protein